MKKEYIQPTMAIEILEVENLLGNGSVNPNEEVNAGDVDSRGFNDWDE